MLTRLENQSTIKINFIMIWPVSGICETLMKWFLVWRTSKDMLGNGLMVLRVCMVGMELEKEMLREEDYSSFVIKKELCVANTWFEMKETRKIAYSMDGNETEIDFLLFGKDNRKTRWRSG